MLYSNGIVTGSHSNIYKICALITLGVRKVHVLALYRSNILSLDTQIYKQLFNITMN